MLQHPGANFSGMAAIKYVLFIQMTGSSWVTVFCTLRYLRHYRYLHPVTKKQITLKYCSIKKKKAPSSPASLPGCAQELKRTKASVFARVDRVMYMIYSVTPTHEISILSLKWIDGRLCQLVSWSLTRIIIGRSWILTFPSTGSEAFELSGDQTLQMLQVVFSKESPSFQILTVEAQRHRIGNVLICSVLISHALEHQRGGCRTVLFSVIIYLCKRLMIWHPTESVTSFSGFGKQW